MDAMHITVLKIYQQVFFITPSSIVRTGSSCLVPLKKFSTRHQGVGNLITNKIFDHFFFYFLDLFVCLFS